MSEQPRNWDRELADIDKVIAKQGSVPAQGAPCRLRWRGDRVCRPARRSRAGRSRSPGSGWCSPSRWPWPCRSGPTSAPAACGSCSSWRGRHHRARRSPRRARELGQPARLRARAVAGGDRVGGGCRAPGSAAAGGIRQGRADLDVRGGARRARPAGAGGAAGPVIGARPVVEAGAVVGTDSRSRDAAARGDVAAIAREPSCQRITSLPGSHGQDVPQLYCR